MTSCLVLASGSPRRREILSGLGLEFEVRPADVDESPLAGEQPAPHVQRLSIDKARARAHPGEVVLAADTVVVLDGAILGKPSDPADAARMIASLAGCRHEVFTGVSVYAASHDRLATGIERTQVDLASLTAAQIDWYVATGEPLDKAGAYAIQGLGSMFVEAVEGNYTNVVGLPVPLTVRLFRQAGHNLLEFRTA